MSLFELTKIEGNSNGPRLLVTAGIHGDEHEGIEATRQLASAIKPDDLNGCLELVPVVNVSAHNLHRRTGDDGLDLARTFPGNPTGTLTEQVGNELASLIRAADYYVDLHSGGSAMLIEPFVGYMLVDTDGSQGDVLSGQRMMARAFGLPIIWGTSPDLEGRSLSVARDAGVPAVYAEYQGGGVCSPDGVEAYVTGCRNVMIRLGMLAGKSTKPSSRLLEIEDPRPSSGHLQMQHKSPTNGTFQPDVGLGDMVSAGDRLGRVDQTPIRAEVSGRLLCLRAKPEVDKGDSLAVILETNRR